MPIAKVGVVRGEEIAYTLTVSVRVTGNPALLLVILDALMNYTGVVGHYRQDYCDKGYLEALEFSAADKRDIDIVEQQILPVLDKLGGFKRVPFPD